MVDTPHPIRTAKLSTIGPDQYCGGGPRGNLGCRMFFFGERCRQIINMPVVILGICRFQVSFCLFLTIFWSKTWTWRPIVDIPLVFLAAFFPFFTVFLALFLVFVRTKTVCIHVWRPCSVSKYGDWIGITALQSMTTVRIPTAEEEGFCKKKVINELISRNTIGILIANFGN